MRILKISGIGLGGLFVLLTIVGFFLPRIAHVERSHVINAPEEIIFNQVNNLKNWEKWSPWHKIDPNMKLTYNGEVGAGASYTWASDHDQVGNGKLTITESIPFKNIKTQMDFMENGTGTAEYILEKVEGGTKVTWTMDSDMGALPWTKLMGPIMEYFIGKDYEKGLAGMAEVSEKEAKEGVSIMQTIEIDEVTLPAQPVLVIREKTTVAEIGQKLGASYGEIGQFMAKNGLKQKGPVFAIYPTFSPTEAFDMEPGIPVDKPAKSSGRIEAKEMKGGKAVVAKYYGPYEGTAKAHEAIDKYLKEHNLKVAGAPWESYVTDPGVEKDPNKVLTEVYYPVQ